MYPASRLGLIPPIIVCFVATLMSLKVQALDGARTSDLNRRFQAAVAFYQHQQYQEAQQILEELLQQAPNAFDFNELMGIVCAAENKRTLANPYLAKAVRLRPKSAEARMYLAANLLELHQEAGAEQEFKKAVELEPGDYDANHNLGEFYVGAGNLPAAIPYLAKARRIEPSAYNNGYDLALAEIRTERYEDARKDIEELLALRNAAELHSLLGTVDEKTGQYLQAAKEFELAAHMEPSESNLFAWGSELLLHHTLEPATQVFQRGIQLYPRSVRLQIGLGIALYSRTHYQQAIDAFCHAIDLSPADPRPYIFLGKIYDVSPLQAEAVTGRFARFAQLQPHNPQALYYYAMSLWKSSRHQSQPADLRTAESLLKTAVTIDPSFAEAHMQLGILYSQQRQYPEAINQYHLAIHSKPDLADAYYHLGEALVRTGERADAQKQFQTFNRLHEIQVKNQQKDRSQILQFVYTTK